VRAIPEKDAGVGRHRFRLAEAAMGTGDGGWQHWFHEFDLEQQVEQRRLAMTFQIAASIKPSKPA